MRHTGLVLRLYQGQLDDRPSDTTDIWFTAQRGTDPQLVGAAGTTRGCIRTT